MGPSARLAPTAGWRVVTSWPYARGSMLAWIKRTLVWLTTGAVFGFVAWSLLGKKLMLDWLGPLGGNLCRADVEMGLDKFVSMQLYSAATGAVVTFLGILLLRRWWLKSRAKPSPPAAGAPGAG